MAPITGTYGGMHGGYGRIGAGSGNSWSDGIRYSDWNAFTGSEIYRAGLAAHLIDRGDGYLYQSLDDPATGLRQRGFEWGFYSTKSTTLDDGDSSVSLEKTNKLNTTYAKYGWTNVYGIANIFSMFPTQYPSTGSIMNAKFDSGRDALLGFIGVALDGIANSKATFKVLNNERNLSLGYYKLGWSGNQWGKTLSLGKTIGAASAGLGIFTTGLAYAEIANGNTGIMTYADAGVGTVSILSTFAAYFSGVEIPYIGEGVAVYGTLSVGWDVFSFMGKENGKLHDANRR